jgi:hypothetical protein
VQHRIGAAPVNDHVDPAGRVTYRIADQFAEDDLCYSRTAAAPRRKLNSRSRLVSAVASRSSCPSATALSSKIGSPVPGRRRRLAAPSFAGAPSSSAKRLSNVVISFVHGAVTAQRRLHTQESSQ